MDVNFLAGQNKQKYLVFVLIAIILIGFLLFLRQKSSSLESQISVSAVQAYKINRSKIDINFQPLNNPVLQSLLPFDSIPIYNEAKNVSISPVFTWQGVQGAENYVFEILDFWTTTVSATSVSLDNDKELKPSTTYVWRVKACNQDLTDCGAWNNNCQTGKEFECRRFVTAGEPVFSLVSPVNEAKNVSISPVFTWQGVQGAENYVFEILDFWTTTVSATSVSLDNDKELKPSTTYVWRVKACNQDLTDCGAWNTRSFSTAFSFAAPVTVFPSADNEIILGRENPFEPY